MTEQSVNDAQEPVLLSWHMSGWRQALTYLACLTGAGLWVLAFAAVMLLPVPLLSIAAVLILLVLAGISLTLIRRIATGFACTNTGIEIRALTGKRDEVPWGEVYKMKRLSGSSAYVELSGDWHLLIAVPSHSIRGLVAILREASNARMSGFG